MSFNRHYYSSYSNQLKILDGLRGIAALYVLVHHARLLLTQPYYEGFVKHRNQYNLIDKSFVYSFSAFKFGHEAVIVFFVLSGFVIHLKQAKKLGTSSGMNVKDYYSKRIIRIYPTLLTAMALTFLLDYFWYLINNKGGVANGGYTLSSFFSNLFLVPDLAIWGNNYPMWSLKHEWFFYLIYPLLYVLTRINYFFPLGFSIILFILFASGIHVPLIGAASYTLLIWWLGAGLAEVYTMRYWFKLKHCQWLAVPAVILLLTPLNHFIYFHDVFFGLLVVALISFLLSTASLGIHTFFSRFYLFGNFSFSIYILHFPILLLVKNLLLKYSSAHILPYNYWFVIAGIFLSIPILYALYYISERPAQHLKAKKFK